MSQDTLFQFHLLRITCCGTELLEIIDVLFFSAPNHWKAIVLHLHDVDHEDERFIFHCNGPVL